MADIDDSDSNLKNSGNLIKNTNADARMKIASVFGGPKSNPDQDSDKENKMEAMRRRQGYQ